MKIAITKKGKIVLFVILGIIVLGSGGYLLWRVLQTETVAPTDSDAGGDSGDDTDGDYCCRFKCCDGTWIKIERTCTEEDPGNTNLCTTNDIDNADMESSCVNHGGYNNCDEDETPIVKCSCQSWADGCGTNCTFPSGTQAKVDAAAASSCSAKIAMCYIQTGETKIEDYGPSHPCYGKISQCNNPYAPNPCTTNTCTGSAWIKEPSGTYSSCSGIIASVDATDPDGIGTNISVKVNGQSRTGYTTASTTSGTSIVYEFSESDCTEPGEYNISFTWDDSKGASSDDCTLTTSFTIVEETEPYCGDGIKQSDEICDPNAEGSDAQCTNNIGETVDCASDCTCPTAQTCGDGILVDGEQCELGNPTGYICTWDTCNQTTCICEEQQNPDWTISKTGAEQCIEEGEETYAKATYSITVTNVGEGEGSIDKIVDELDDKVLEAYLNDISGNGVYASGLITWDLEGDDEILSPDESLTLTYYIKVPADSFGIYQNIATAYPTEGDEFSDDESVTLTCNIPQTGIFDSILVRISVGVVLILLGMNWSKINYSVNETISNTRIKKFERKVAKKK